MWTQRSHTSDIDDYIFGDFNRGDHIPHSER